MSRKNSKQLVIDASLALGSDDRKFNPMGVNQGDLNRKCLLAIREERHVAVFSAILRREWRDHAGPHATEWLRVMDRKNQTADHEGAEFSRLLAPSCECLASDSHRRALAKDFHLIQSALASGQTILSNEKKFPGFVASACGAVWELASLYYANPAVEGDICILWIKAGAEKEVGRRIEVWKNMYGRGN